MSEAAGGPEAGAFLCPRCGLRQPPGGAECPGCGVVFAKLAAPPPAAEPDPDDTVALRVAPLPPPVPPIPNAASTAAPGRRRPPVFRVARTAPKGIWPGYWVLLALALLGAIYFWPRRNAAPRLTVRGDAAAIAGEIPASSLDGAPVVPTPRGTARTGPSAAPAIAPVLSTAAVRELPAVRAPLTWYEGAQGYRKGVDEARLDHRPLAIYLFTDSCADCRQVSDGLLRSSEVTDYLRGVVKVRLNPAAGADQKAIVDELGVADFPTLLLIPAGGSARLIATTVAAGTERRLATPTELILRIQRAIGGS